MSVEEYCRNVLGENGVWSIASSPVFPGKTGDEAMWSTDIEAMATVLQMPLYAYTQH